MSVARDEGLFLSAVVRAQVDEPLPKVTWVLYLLLAALVVALTWSALAHIDQVTRSEGRIVPEAREQVIASMEMGTLRDVLVREGQQVEQGQDLARLDPTRVESAQNEGVIRRLSLMATVARLSAEASGRPLQFPPELKAQPGLVRAETEAYEARRLVQDEAVAALSRSAGLVGRELRIAQDMATKGLMSDVEVMRLNRQINELQQQRNERVARFRQEAASELVRAQGELALIDEQMVVRQDALTRTVLKSPVKGLVKNIRANTVGGVITPGAPIMEIVPLSDRVLIEARIRSADVGFIRLGQRAVVKLAGYDYNLNGGLEGKVEYISPDALTDVDGRPAAEGRYYRVLVRAESNTLRYQGEALPVMPGMTGTVEIRTGERSVLSYIFRPLMKAREALQER